ncbi:hypothetical protein IBB3154_14 (plasmid) [Ligilactobacillus salivarius]|uniref:hypothetical protein n=1 Tax=Ligilactobacillus salivarius TaxID=1624 RepID=UPI0013DE0914|nr:hypothetical protein [Ligilactobacillus salivarius]QIG37564.1 hypothetical protein IBB3154_14 [Ligilactobacillus salivarius]
MTKLDKLMEDNQLMTSPLFSNQGIMPELIDRAMKDSNLSYTSKGILLDLVRFNQNGADSTKFDPTVLYAINNSKLDDKELIRSALSELEKGGYLTPLSSK